jgi:hypothetical protein
VYVAVKNVENLDVGWCLCIDLCVCVCVCVCVCGVRRCIAGSLPGLFGTFAVWYTWSRDLGTLLINFIKRGVENSGRNWCTWSRHLAAQLINPTLAWERDATRTSEGTRVRTTLLRYTQLSLIYMFLFYGIFETEKNDKNVVSKEPVMAYQSLN